MRGRIEGIHSTCCQIILSLLKRCPLVRVSFKRGTTVQGFVKIYHGIKNEMGAISLGYLVLDLSTSPIVRYNSGAGFSAYYK